MTRTALARRYRPRRFAEVARQEHVSETLKAAVARGRVAHAYLFSGPRGVGKTTAARVLAMALNCPERDEEGEPCGECESCEKIWAGRTSLDVIEIDAASNRGVDDARELRERAMYAPTDEQRYKVYIIDEAHMLTREAWNALLKILEEPPPRVIFVFATTEPQKIQQAAPPILSRCQRFDFRRIGAAAIVERLRQVLDDEGVEADDDALLAIARRAGGGMRDALSLLDQVLSFTRDRLDGEEVRRVLGLVGEEVYLELFGILAERRYADVFRFVQRLLDEGYDLAEFHRGLADALRSLLIVRLDGAEAAEVRPDLRERYAERAGQFGVGDLLQMLARVAELDTDGRFRKSANPRIMLEALLLRFAHLDRTVEVEALLDAAASGDAAPPTDTGGDGPGTASAGRGPTDRRSSGGAVPDRASGAARSSGSASPGETRSGPAGAGDVRTSSGPASTRSGADTESAAAGAVAGGRAHAPEDEGAAAALRSMLRQGEGIPPGMGLFLRAATIRDAQGDRLVVELPQGPGLERLTSKPTARRALEDALRERVGRRVELEVRPQNGEAPDAAPAPRITPDQVRNDRLQRLADEEPALRRAVQEWDLELLE